MTVESLEHLQILDTEPTVDQVEDCRAMAEESQQEPKRQWDRYRDQFMSVFPELVDGITKGGLGNPEISDAIQHIKSVSVIHNSITCTIIIAMYRKVNVSFKFKYKININFHFSASRMLYV